MSNDQWAKAHYENDLKVEAGKPDLGHVAPPHRNPVPERDGQMTAERGRLERDISLKLIPRDSADDIRALLADHARLQAKLGKLQAMQARMRDPERQMVCDIIANGMDRETAGVGRYEVPDAQPAPAIDLGQPIPGIFDKSDTVAVPREMIAAACGAILHAGKYPVDRILAQLRRYTTGDLSKPHPAPAIDLEKFRMLAQGSVDALAQNKVYPADVSAAIGSMRQLLALIDGQAGTTGWLSDGFREIAGRAERLAAKLASQGASVAAGQAEGIATTARMHGWNDPRPHARSKQPAKGEGVAGE